MNSKPMNFLKKAGTILGGIIGLAVLCAVFNFVTEKVFPATPTPTRVPTATIPVRVKGAIYDFMDSRQIQVQMKGDDINAVEMLINKLVEDALEVEVPVGTLIIPGDEDLQRMVVRNPKIIYLDSNLQVDVNIDVSCTDYWKDVPHSTDSFAEIIAPPDDELTRLMQTIDASDDLSYEYAFYSVTQAAVWIITADASYSGLGRLVVSSGGQYDYFNRTTTRVIDEEEAVRAMFLVHRSGIDITTKKIWEDRATILQVLEDQPLIDWIHSLE